MSTESNEDQQLATLNRSIIGLSPSIEIRCSPIEGFGLFAKEAIPAGAYITKFDGEIMNRVEFKALYGNDTRYCYVSNFPWYPVIVAKEHRNAITYCNEAKDPNCYLKKYFLIAGRDIAADEELTLRYGKRYPRDYDL